MAGQIQRAAGVAVAKRAPSSIQDYIKVMAPEIKKALPSVMTPERFTRITLSALSTNQQLGSCTPKSFLGAMMTAAQLGLEPNTPLGQAYLLPFKNHGVLECQFQLGYKGLIDLAYRSGEVTIIQAHTVYSNDEFDYELGLHPQLRHVPAAGERGEPVYFYAMFQTKSGGYGFEVMSKSDIDAHARRYSQSFRRGTSSPWQTNYEEMAKKTVLKRVLKYAPLKSDFVRGLAQDGTIKTELSEDMYSVPAVSVEEYETVAEDAAPHTDPATGEVLDDASQQ